MADAKTPNPRELYELKQQAIRYFNSNGVPQKMEEILNTMFYENPDDVFGHLANYFEGYAKPPVISKVSAHEVIDSKGQPTIQTDIHCTIKNFEKLVSSEVLSSENYFPEAAKVEDRELEDEEREQSVKKALDFMNGLINEVLTGSDPCDIAQADTLVFESLDKVRLEKEEEEKRKSEAGEREDAESGMSPTPKAPESPQGKGKVKSAGKSKPGKGAPVVIVPDEPREVVFPGFNAICGVSLALCHAGAVIKDVPLYEHIAQVYHDQVPSEFCVPQPMVTIISGGKAAPGKSNCIKDYMIIPAPTMPIKKSVKHILGIYSAVSRNLTIKGGSAAKNTNDIGALCPMLDRPEQGIDMIQDAMTSLGLTAGEDFHIAINCAGHETFDHEKGKYEVVLGQQKDPDGLIEFWSEMLSRYPSVIAVCDPVRKEEKDIWMRLCEKISDRCYIVGDHAHHRPGRLIKEELTEDFKTSGVVMRLEQMNSVSDIMNASKKMAEAENQIILSTNVGETNSTLLADLATGCGFRFLAVGAPCRGERVGKLNRLLEIENELEANGKLSTWPSYTFPVITPPPPPSEGDEGEADGESGRHSESPRKK